MKEMNEMLFFDPFSVRIMVFYLRSILVLSSEVLSIHGSNQDAVPKGCLPAML